jgi:predicted permease
MRSALVELKVVWRALARRKSYTIATSLVLGMLIATATVVFSAVNAILLRPLPVRDADQLVALCEFTTKERDPFCVSTPPNAVDIGARTRSFDGLGQARDWPLTLRTTAGGEGISGGLATPGFFRTVGIAPKLGRTFNDDEVGKSAHVAVVTDAFARQRLGSSRDALGKSLTLDNQSVTIIGVLPADVYVPTLERVAVWVPLPFDPRDEENRGWRGFRTFARVREGTTIETARRELASIASALHDEHFRDNADWRIEMMPLKELVVGSVSRGLTMLFGAVGLVLLVGCANLANLVLARTTQRRPELALRMALGASSSALARTLLTECAVLSGLGALVGLPLAAWLTDALRLLAPAGLPRVGEVQFDLTAVTFAIILSLVITVLIGTVPVFLTRRFGSREVLDEGGRGGIDSRSASTGRTLVGVQLAIACVLLTGAIVLGRSFNTMARWDPGFPLDRELATWLLAPPERFATGEDAARVFERVVDEVRSLPGVERVATVSAGPLFGGIETGSALPDNAGRDARGINTRWYDVSPGFFQALGVQLQRGRDIDERDVIGAPLVAVVNERLAALLWPGKNPLGRRIRFNVGSEEAFEVVGVVSNVPPMNPSAIPQPEIYWSNRQQPRWGTFLLVRTSSDPSASVSAIRARVKAIRPELQIGTPATLKALADRQLVVPRFATLLVGGFGTLALAIAAVGLFGLQAYIVAQRTREFGVRLALGASPSDVRWFVIGQGLRTGAVALGAGLLLAQIAARPLAGLLAGASAHDPITLISVTAGLGLVTLLGSLVPAHRAANLSPNVALRSE